MKKLLLVLMLLMLPFTGMGNYPFTLKNYPNFEWYHGHMMYAQYMDTSSITVMEKEDFTLWTVPVLSVDFKKNFTVKKVHGPELLMFCIVDDPNKTYLTAEFLDKYMLTIPIYIGEDRAYISYDKGKNWTAFVPSSQLGVNQTMVAPFEMIRKLTKTRHSFTW